MTIRARWDADADEYNQFEALGSDEIEKFADSIITTQNIEIERLRAEIEQLKKKLNLLTGKE